MQKCPICSGEIKTEKLPFTYTKDNQIKVIPDVLHHVCQSCGERFIIEEESRKIDEYIKQSKQD